MNGSKAGRGVCLLVARVPFLFITSTPFFDTDLKVFLMFYFLKFLEREGEIERERERNIKVREKHGWVGSHTCNLLVYGTAHQPTEPHQPVLFKNILYDFNLFTFIVFWRIFYVHLRRMHILLLLEYSTYVFEVLAVYSIV